MKDWIKSPEPEDPDEVLARHRKYEQEEDEDRERRNEASTSQLPSATMPTTAARTVVVGKRRRHNSTSRSPEANDSPSRFAPTNRNVRTRLASSSSTAASAVKAEPDDGSLLAGLYGTTPPPDGEHDAVAAAASPALPPYLPDHDEDPDPTRPVPLKPRPRRKSARLMSLADMSFRTVLTHLPSLDSSEISSIIQPELPRLSHRYSAPLAQACDAHLDHLARLSRAKEAALRAREEARVGRRSSVAIDTTGVGGRARGVGVAGGGLGKPKVQKSQGGKKIWMRAKMAAGVRR